MEHVKLKSTTSLGICWSSYNEKQRTLNITCNFLYCNYQVHRDFLITLCVMWNFQPSCGAMRTTTSQTYRPIASPVISSSPDYSANIWTHPRHVACIRQQTSGSRYLWRHRLPTSRSVTSVTEVLRHFDLFYTFSEWNTLNRCSNRNGNNQKIKKTTAQELEIPQYPLWSILNSNA
jgi:hypothetical protein